MSAPQQPAEAVAWIAEKTGRSSFTGKVRTDRAAFLTYPADAEADGYHITPLYLAPPPAIDIQQQAEAVAVDAVTPRPMETAPRDGTIVRLLVNFTDNATEDVDADTPIWTIGGNTLEGTGEDVWQFAGWNWQQDCFTQGEGTPIGWLPLIGGDTPPPAIDIGKLRELVAKAIYSQWTFMPGWVEWVENGNSARQDDARQLAQAHIDASGIDAAPLIGDGGEGQ